jgi:hypothetical protein
LLEFDEEDVDWDYQDDIEPEWFDTEPEGFRCQACYGSGLDREYDTDCIVCFGEGYVDGFAV